MRKFTLPRWVVSVLVWWIVGSMIVFVTVLLSLVIGPFALIFAGWAVWAFQRRISRERASQLAR